MPTTPPTADEALQRLVDGNARWANAKPQNPRIDATRREDVAANGQKPYASILTCADSRIPVERVFDAGVGDLFVVRVAGNIAGPSESGSLEYGVEHLKTPLLIVLGHSKCGAVAAAAANAKVGGHIAGLINSIQPAVARARKANPGMDEKELVVPAVRENVHQTIFDLLRNSPDVRHLVKDGNLKVIGGVYDIATGRVDWLGEHPWQDELVSAFDARDAQRAASAALREAKHETHETKEAAVPTEDSSHTPGH
ncbi:MAG: carbonic anhydrase [Phycisphaerales bacterium]